MSSLDPEIILMTLKRVPNIIPIIGPGSNGSEMSSYLHVAIELNTGRAMIGGPPSGHFQVAEPG